LRQRKIPHHLRFLIDTIKAENEGLRAEIAALRSELAEAKTKNTVAATENNNVHATGNNNVHATGIITSMQREIITSMQREIITSMQREIIPLRQRYHRALSLEPCPPARSDADLIAILKANGLTQARTAQAIEREEIRQLKRGSRKKA
jgi:phenylalanyl-tRNA synthetase alpha subunit